MWRLDEVGTKSYENIEWNYFFFPKHEYLKLSMYSRQRTYYNPNSTILVQIVSILTYLNNLIRLSNHTLSFYERYKRVIELEYRTSNVPMFES